MVKIHFHSYAAPAFVKQNAFSASEIVEEGAGYIVVNNYSNCNYAANVHVYSVEEM